MQHDTMVDRGEIFFWYQTYYAVFQQNIQDVSLELWQYFLRWEAGIAEASGSGF